MLNLRVKQLDFINYFMIKRSQISICCTRLIRVFFILSENLDFLKNMEFSSCCSMASNFSRRLQLCTTYNWYSIIMCAPLLSMVDEKCVLFFLFFNVRRILLRHIENNVAEKTGGLRNKIQKRKKGKTQISRCAFKK